MRGFGEDFNPDDILLLGTCVIALFPSLDIEEVAQEIMQELLETEMRIEEVDWQELSLYIAMNLAQEKVEKLPVRMLIPTRRHTGDPRPSCTGEIKKKEVPDVESKWILPTGLEPDLLEIRYHVALSVRIAVQVCFSNYIYSLCTSGSQRVSPLAHN